MSLDPAANALTTVTAVREVAGTGPSDDRLQRLINSISGAIEKTLKRSLVRKTWTTDVPQQLQGNGSTWVRVSSFPIESIDAVTLEAIAQVQDTDFSCDSEMAAWGNLYRPKLWTARRPVTDRVTFDQDSKKSAYNVTVAYTGGYWLPSNDDDPPDTAIPLPADLEQLCIDEALERLARPIQGVAEEQTPGGWRRKFTDPQRSSTSGLLLTTELSLNAYRAPKAFFA